MACFQSAEDGSGKLKPEQAGENRNARLKLKEGGEIMKSDVKKSLCIYVIHRKTQSVQKQYARFRMDVFLQQRNNLP